MIYLTYQFNKVTYTVCDDVAQWDTNQVMKISNLPHYCTYNLSYSKNGNIITTETYLIEDSLIPFPNECFFEAGTIHCYIQREQDGETETIADIIINVKERSIPSNTRSYDVRAGKLFVSSDGVKEGTMPEYDGDTSVIPSKEAIVLKTRNQFIKDNITIDPIPEKYIEPNGTKIITDNRLYDIAEFENVDVNVNTVPLLQEKTITPTRSSQTVTADEGFDGLSVVNIDPIPDEYVIQNLQEKTIIPTKSAQDVTADEDYTGLSTVHVEPIPDEYIIPNLQEKTVTPSDSEQSITADDGYTGLSSVTVEKIAKPFIDSSKFTNFYCMFSSIYGNSDISVLENLDTSNGTNFSYMFYGNINVVNLSLDTHNGKDFQYFCSGCGNLRNVIKIDVSNATTTFAMFHLCYNLETIPELNTVNVKDFRSMFFNCDKYLTTIPSINLSNGEKYSNMFYNCTSLSSITFDGTVNIRSNDLSFAYCPLTEESLASLINALSDNSGLDTTYTVTLGANNIAKLTEEQLAIVAAKNINLA